MFPQTAGSEAKGWILAWAQSTVCDTMPLFPNSFSAHTSSEVKILLISLIFLIFIFNFFSYFFWFSQIRSTDTQKWAHEVWPGVKQPRILYKWLWKDLCTPLFKTRFSLNMSCYLWRKDQWSQVQRGDKTALFFTLKWSLFWGWHERRDVICPNSGSLGILWWGHSQGGSRHEFIALLLICSIKKNPQIICFHPTAVARCFAERKRKRKKLFLPQPEFHSMSHVKSRDSFPHCHPKSSLEQPHVFDLMKWPQK